MLNNNLKRFVEFAKFDTARKEKINIKASALFLILPSAFGNLNTHKTKDASNFTRTENDNFTCEVGSQQNLSKLIL